jgi:hypothetical protein
MIDRIEVPMNRLKNGVTVIVDGDTGEMIYDGDIV